MSEWGKTKLSEKIKELEKACETSLCSEGKAPEEDPIIWVRLDGNSFSKFTKSLKLEKPFDRVFDIAMTSATRAVMKYCHAEVAYCQSDEVSFGFNPFKNENSQPFLGGRTQKLSSLLASTMSVHFFRELDIMYKRRAGVGLSSNQIPVFDGRAFVTSTRDEAVGYLKWRQADCSRNYWQGRAHYALKKEYGSKAAQRAMHGASVKELVHLLWDLERGDDAALEDVAEQLEEFFEQDPYHRLGRTMLKENYEEFAKDVMPQAEYNRLVEKGWIEPDKMVVRSRLVEDEIKFTTENVLGFLKIV